MATATKSIFRKQTRKSKASVRGRCWTNTTVTSDDRSTKPQPHPGMLAAIVHALRSAPHSGRHQSPTGKRSAALRSKERSSLSRADRSCRFTGRPVKLTPELQKRICEIIAAGSTYQAAADAVGISYQTLLNWKAAGSGRRSGHYFDFFDAIRAAENHALTLVEETHYQLITTGIERVREHVKEELDEHGNVIKRLRERTKETVTDPVGMRWFQERRDPERWPTVRMIEHSGAIDTSRARPVEVVVKGLKLWVDDEEEADNEYATVTVQRLGQPNPLIQKGSRQGTPSAPSSPSSIGGGRSPERGVLPHIGASPEIEHNSDVPPARATKHRRPRTLTQYLRAARRKGRMTGLAGLSRDR